MTEICGFHPEIYGLLRKSEDLTRNLRISPKSAKSQGLNRHTDHNPHTNFGKIREWNRFKKLQITVPTSTIIKQTDWHNYEKSDGLNCTNISNEFPSSQSHNDPMGQFTTWNVQTKLTVYLINYQ